MLLLYILPDLYYVKFSFSEHAIQMTVTTHTKYYITYSFVFFL